MQTNFLVIGSGIAGLNFALHAAQKGQVLLITKKKIIDSNTNYAQGGIAAVLDRTDKVEKLIEDTLKAGAYHNNKKALRFMAEKSTAAIHRLIELGVQFEKEKGKLKLTKEGGHGQRRIAYVGDYTGKEIENILVKRVKEHPNITILENTFALDLITKNKTCHGAQIIHKNKIQNVQADQTILATGGIGQLFLHTTNAKIATGDGLAMAERAACKSKDLEFIQFHPTALDKNTFPKFLISEALRGEGAKLLNSEGKRFTKELASRDIVARAIYEQEGPVYLDIRHKNASYLKKRFPKIYEKLTEHGYNLAKDLIPVTPAMHYICGGITTNLKGQTNIKNLFAFGEVSCSGVHGANRLASNSLLEALVFSNQIVKNLKISNTNPQSHIITKETFTKKVMQGNVTHPKLLPKTSPHTKTARKLKKEIQKLMWNHAGIIRNILQIKNIAIPAITKITQELETIPGTNQEIAEARNMALVSQLILQAAQKRKTSLGCHFVQ